MTKTKIVSAALRLPNGLIISLPAPKRHHHLINGLGMWAEGLGADASGFEHEQGFLTDEGRYVTREEAKVIAGVGSHPTQLFSEDLW